jgi:hypothetical protein
LAARDALSIGLEVKQKQRSVGTIAQPGRGREARRRNRIGDPSSLCSVANAAGGGRFVGILHARFRLYLSSAQTLADSITVATRVPGAKPQKLIEIIHIAIFAAQRLCAKEFIPERSETAR